MLNKKQLKNFNINNNQDCKMYEIHLYRYKADKCDHDCLYISDNYKEILNEFNRVAMHKSQENIRNITNIILITIERAYFIHNNAVHYKIVKSYVKKWGVK